MRRLLVPGLILTVIASMAIGLAQAESDNSEVIVDDGSVIYGRWVTHRGAQIELAPCGNQATGQLCGFIATILEKDPTIIPRDKKNPDPSLRNKPLLGLPIFYNFSYYGENRWKKGKVYNPENGKTYKAKLKMLDSHSLRAGGCWWIFCRTYVWKRAEPVEQGKP